MNEVWGRKYSPVSFTLVMGELTNGLSAKYVYETQISF